MLPQCAVPAVLHYQVPGALRLYALLGSSRLTEYGYPLPLVEEGSYMVVGILQGKAIVGEVAHSL